MISKRIVLLVQVLTLVLGLAGSKITRAEKLPIKTFTTADGLAHNNVIRIVRDSRGFLWFCTFEGLSRFDGYSFTTYGADQGLPSQVVNDLLETRDGQYWVATDAGLCRFNPNGVTQQRASDNKPAVAMFVVYFPAQDPKSREVKELLQDHTGAILCATVGGIYRLEQESTPVKFQRISLGQTQEREGENEVTCMIEDRRGALWVGSLGGLYRLLPDGRVEHYSDRNGLPKSIYVHSIFEDRDGRLWVGSRLSGLSLLVSDPDPTRSVVERTYTPKDGLPCFWINQMLQASDGSLWAGSAAGLLRFIPNAGGADFRFRVYGQAHGLNSPYVQCLAEDLNGNLWLGMSNGGVSKLARSGITAFGEADRFKTPRAIFKDHTGDLNVVTVSEDTGYVINRFDGERFDSIRPNLPRSIYYGWGWNGLVVEDREGEWWLTAGQGIYRFPKVRHVDSLAHAKPLACYTKRDGLASSDLLRLFEDSRNDIWVACANPGGLSRWDRATSTFHSYTEHDGLPSLTNSYPISFTEDLAGNLWIGFSLGGGLVRYRNGRFTQFGAADGITEGGIFNLFVDSKGRLWVPTTRGGVCRIDHPEEERPAVVNYNTADGLSSNDVKVAVEDRLGRIYFGTGRGIDRLEIASGHIRHYSANEGALLGDINAASQDRDGALWFSYVNGLIRLIPESDETSTAPPILVTGLRVGGEAQAISAFGETEVPPLELSANRNELQIDFVALGFSPGEGLRYQYLLEGAQQDWSSSLEQRTVNFANLAPGRYRFLVRAINADGIASDKPASFSFRILPPLWLRWWFISIIVLFVAALAYSLYRYRVGRLLEIERIRTRIAADLHDDIGSSLSQIAVLSEVLRKQLGSQETRIANNISLISRVTQEALDSMSDIVWAINPRQDHLNDLIRRMRRVASEMLPARDIEFAFVAPTDGLDLKLGADIRRELFLMFKEAVNNVVRHSGCKRAEIELRVQGAMLVLKVVDDGVGFEPNSSVDGNGLVSLRRRARALGGETLVASRKGSGSTINVTIPHSQNVRHNITGSPTNGRNT